MPLTQANRKIAIETPLGEDVLLLRSFSFSEQIGRLFQVEVDLLSTNAELNFDELVGQNATIRMELGNGEDRYLNGYISRFVQTRQEGTLAQYRATLVPWLWFLTRMADCRIFQKTMPEPPNQMTVPGIIQKVFKDHGFKDVRDALTQTYPEWDYCVQYRETDFKFVSRLMEQEGIYYFFEHENGKHTLVLADSASAHQPFAGYEEVVYRLPSQGMSGRECVSDWVREKVVQSGVYALNDFNFETPKQSLQVKSKVTREHAAADYEIYDYPGEFNEYSEGESYAKWRIEELQAQHDVIHGQSNARGLCAGFLFNLVDHPRADQNRDYLLTGVSFQADGGEFESRGGATSGESFSGSFTAMPADNPFRPARITSKPLIQGPQTAIVVGPKGEEIHTDKYGRVKVQFHWDRHSKADENSSCWVRVSQVWAGKKWGAMYIPRIGQEVMVEFLEGDPDQPIITGRVYNAEAMPPYDLPDKQTVSTLKSNSSKGGQGFNEIRFEDEKGEEQMFLHGEKNQDIRIKNDTKEWIGNERHLIVIKDQLEKVDGDKHGIVGGDQLVKVTGDVQVTVEGNRLTQIKTNENVTVDGDHAVKITGDSGTKVEKNINEEAGQKISIKAGMDFHEKAGQNYAMDAGMKVHIKGGMTVVIEAGMQVSLKAGPSFVDIGPSGVSISGPMVMINSGGSAGSGDGSSPTAPAAPEAPEAPKEALEADTADPGEVEEPPPAPEPPTPTSYSSSAQVLKNAAESGTPFCEECERARAAATPEGH